MNLSKLQEMVKDRGVWHTTVHGITKNQTWLSNWRKTTRATLKNIAREKSGLHPICGSLRLDINMSWTLFASGTLYQTASRAQGNCLSSSFFWVSLGMTLNLGKIVSFAPSLGMPLEAMFVQEYLLKLDKVFKIYFYGISVVKIWPNWKLIFRA